jgi:signal transduction histidine kinase
MLIRRDLELTKANENLQKLDKMKSVFISTAAHQLRTPLSGIKWTLSMILNNDIKKKDEQKAFLMKVYESNDRIINLVNDMLVADRVESSTEKYDFVPTDLSVILDSVILDLLPQINKKNILINIINNNIPKIYVDSLKIRSVFQNLLENAIKYSKENGRIDLDFIIKDNFIQFSIKDNGIGIPESQKQNIFSKFFRGENAKRIVTDGTGLGLFIVHSVVEKHGGKIWFESEENKGTSFYFTLPIS